MNNDNFIGNVIDSKIYYICSSVVLKSYHLSGPPREARLLRPWSCQDFAKKNPGRWKQMREVDVAILSTKDLPWQPCL